MQHLIRTYPNVRQKYVLVRAKKNEEEVLLLWGNPDIDWHKDIVEEMEGVGIEVVEVFGGGWLFAGPDNGSVHVWGKSDRFGPAPMGLVRGLLGEDVIEKEPA